MSGLQDGLRLPQEIERYIASLERVYDLSQKKMFQRILVNAKPLIEEHSYDNWDGGQTGFLLRLRIPDALFTEVIENRAEIEQQINQDIEALINIQGEFIAAVSIEMQLVEDEDWRTKSEHLIVPRREVPDKAVSRIWGEGTLNVFLSHKAEHKRETSELRERLEAYGLSCFVAHEDIQPSKEWQNEIEKALFSMDVLIALMTDDFHDSDWTDQEVGVAIGRGVPVISVKIGKDPYGFIGKYQAIKGSWTDIWQIAKDTYEILVKQGAFREKLINAAIYRLKTATSYTGCNFIVKKILPRFGNLDTTHVERIQEAFSQNDQMYGSNIVCSDLPGVLYDLTKIKYRIEKRMIIEDAPQTGPFDADDIPF